jgi:hypothetical protein
MSPRLIANRAATLIQLYGPGALSEAINNVAMAKECGHTAVAFNEAVLAEVRRLLDKRGPRRDYVHRPQPAAAAALG